MSKDLPEPQPSEEVDLGQLFKLIGNVFQKIADFFVAIFKGLFKIVLLTMIHFYKRFKWYAGAVIIGAVLGYVLDKSSEEIFGANMIIETNFGSSRQVYENIRNLHELASVDGNSEKLGEILEIPAQLAAKLKGFYIMPDIDDNDKIEIFSNFYTKLDSTSKSETRYDEYIKSLDLRTFKRHQIGVTSTNKQIYSKLTKFADAISKNTYLDNLLKVSHENLKREDETLKKQEDKIDTLVKQYLKIRINESERVEVPNSGTTLNMGSTGQNTLLINEANLVEKKLQLATKRRKINNDLVEKQNIISIVSNFPATGYDISEWHQKKKFILPILLFGLTLIIFIGLGLGNYLKQQDKLLNEA